MKSCFLSVVLSAIASCALAQPPGPPPNPLDYKQDASDERTDADYWMQTCQQLKGDLNTLKSSIDFHNDSSTHDEAIAAAAAIAYSSAMSHFTLMHGKWSFDYSAGQSHFDAAQQAYDAGNDPLAIFANGRKRLSISSRRGCTRSI